MSDFDKEAEREKLRAKYEEDTKDREATERMSDLLLKGATMTDTHCGTCGDPIFRHEGQEFCPSCQEVITEGEQSTQQTQQQPDVDESPPADGPETGVADATPTDVSPDTNVADGSAVDVTSNTAEKPSLQNTGGDASARSTDTATAREAAVSRQQDNTTATTATPASGSQSVSEQQEQAIDTDSESLVAARTSLTRTVTRLAQQAEASDDLERARAYLAATEEAADALAAVKRADR